MTIMSSWLLLCATLPDTRLAGAGAGYRDGTGRLSAEDQDLSGESSVSRWNPRPHQPTVATKHHGGTAVCGEHQEAA